MSYTPYPPNREFNTDAAVRTRVSQMTTLFDGKSIGADNTILWQSTGTGTGSFSQNLYSMSVAAVNGQYVVRSGRHPIPYFSGKSQLIEISLDGFQPQTNVIKRAGYFSSGIVAPFATNQDGFFVETDNTTVYLTVVRNGITVVRIPTTSWDNAAKFATYDWSTFTIVAFDFLWLGGSELRMFIKTADGFVLAHTYKHASLQTGTFLVSPNQSVRYEIRSLGGAGSMRAICSQVSSEGSIAEDGQLLTVYNPALVNANTINVIYALKSIRRSASFRDIPVYVLSAGVTCNTTTDIGTALLILNPTLSGTMGYAANSKIEESTSTTVTVTAGTGRVVAAFPSAQLGAAYSLNNSIYSAVGASLTGTSDELVLAYRPTTATQAVYGHITVKEY